jgi:hypothetical protein
MVSNVVVVVVAVFAFVFSFIVDLEGTGSTAWNSKGHLEYAYQKGLSGTGNEYQSTSNRPPHWYWFIFVLVS